MTTAFIPQTKVEHLLYRQLQRCRSERDAYVEALEGAIRKPEEERDAWAIYREAQALFRSREETSHERS